MNPTIIRIRPSRTVVALMAMAVSGLGSGVVHLTSQPQRASAVTSAGSAAWAPRDGADPAPVEVGARFSSSAAGTVTGVRFYKTIANTGTHVASLWTTSGTRLASGTTTPETASGWQTVTFAQPVTIAAGTKYVVSYYAPHGHYASREYAFANGKTITDSSITTDAGLYAYGSTSRYPVSSWHDSSYFVAPVVSTGPSPTTTSTPSPTTTSTPSPTTTTATPSPTTTTATPSPTTSTPPVDPAWPTPATTGWQHTGVTLTAYTGPSTITAPNTVIDGKDIKTCLVIRANNVTIRNSRITCAGSSPTDSGTMLLQQSDAYTPNVTGLNLTDVELTRPAGNTGGADYGILLYGQGVTLTRVNIHNVTSGIHFSGRGVVLQDSYLGGFVNISGVDHIDGVIANGGAADVTMRHNTIEVPVNQTTPIAMFPEGTPNSYWVVDHNLLSGGGYCIYPSYTKGSEQPNHHITMTDNVFSRKFFTGCGAAGPVDGGKNGARFLDGVGNTWSGNTWDNGAPVNAS